MADAATDTAPGPHLDVLTWRYQCLTDAGYPVEVAILLAQRGDVDLHLAVGLLARGASVEQALAIVA